MITYIYEVLSVDGCIIARVDAKNEGVALEIVKSMHPNCIYVLVK